MITLQSSDSEITSLLPTRLRQLQNMIQTLKPLSSLNQELLNKIIGELAQSLLKPSLEFDEILIESFMYPRGSDSLMLNCKSQVKSTNEDDTGCKFGVHDMGHVQILEMIQIRNIITKLINKLDNVTSVDFVDEVQKLSSQLETNFYHLLKQLSLYIEVPKCSDVYRVILTKQLSNFQQFFISHKLFSSITENLIQTATLTGQDKNKCFQVDITLSDMITKFITRNNKWMETMLLESIAFQEFQATHQDSQPASKILRSRAFRHYLQERKNRLRILHRTL